MNELISI